MIRESILDKLFFFKKFRGKISYLIPFNFRFVNITSGNFMPAIFMTGSGSLIASGSEEAVSKVLGDVADGWSGVSISYVSSNGVDSEFDILIRDLVDGCFSIVKVNKTSVKCEFRGNARAMVQSAAIKDILIDGINWKIETIKGGGCGMSALSEVYVDQIKLEKKARKLS